jgi:glycine cleavage system transcriptional repressor
MTTAPSLSVYAVQVLLKDRVGILRDVTTATANMGGNIIAISQTVVSDYFTVTFVAAFDSDPGLDRVREGMLASLPDDHASVIVTPFEGAVNGARARTAGDYYIVTLIGNDRPGILKTITTFLADQGINIEDWTVAFDGPGVTHIGEVRIPGHLDIKQVQDECRRLMTPLGLTAHIQHENIFRATNELGRISLLLMEPGHAAHR